MSLIPRVLVIDDHDSLRRNLVALLEDYGLEVAEAGSGEQAMEVVRTREIDVAVVDIRLPGMSGDQFVERAHVERPRLRFLIHTGSMDFQVPEPLLAIGLAQDAVFMKPIGDIDRFIARIHAETLIAREIP